MWLYYVILINCFFHLMIYCEHFPMSLNTTQCCHFLMACSIPLYVFIIQPMPYYWTFKLFPIFISSLKCTNDYFLRTNSQKWNFLKGICKILRVFLCGCCGPRISLKSINKYGLLPCFLVFSLVFLLNVTLSQE